LEECVAPAQAASYPEGVSDMELECGEEVEGSDTPAMPSGIQQDVGVPLTCGQANMPRTPR